MSNDIERYRSLVEKAEDLKTRKIRLEEKCKAKEKELRKLVGEIKDMGFDPQSLKSTIEKMEKEQKEDIDSFDKKIDEISSKLSKIEEGQE